jgi:hypothetical protein
VILLSSLALLCLHSHIQYIQNMLFFVVVGGSAGADERLAVVAWEARSAFRFEFVFHVVSCLCCFRRI